MAFIAARVVQAVRRQRSWRRRFATHAGRVLFCGADAREAVVGGTDPERGLSRRSRSQMGQADVVGVHVGDDHAQQRQAVELLEQDQN